MAKIPNYIIKKIERHNALVGKAAKLEAEIDEWYGKQFTKHKGTASTIPDEDFADVKCDMSATYVSMENMLYNLDLIGNSLGCIERGEANVTDREIMYHRFCHKNIKKGTGTLCKELGMTKKEYDDACRRAMEEEAQSMKSKTLNPYKEFQIEKSYEESADGTIKKDTIVYTAYTDDDDNALFDAAETLSDLKRKIDEYLK